MSTVLLSRGPRWGPVGCLCVGNPGPWECPVGLAVGGSGSVGCPSSWTLRGGREGERAAPCPRGSWAHLCLPLRPGHGHGPWLRLLAGSGCGLGRPLVASWGHQAGASFWGRGSGQNTPSPGRCPLQAGSATSGPGAPGDRASILARVAQGVGPILPALCPRAWPAARPAAGSPGASSPGPLKRPPEAPCGAPQVRLGPAAAPEAWLLCLSGRRPAVVPSTAPILLCQRSPAQPLASRLRAPTPCPRGLPAAAATY